MPSADLKGKVAWITGGGSGMGLAGAKELAAAGAHVVISGRTARTNDSGLAELRDLGQLVFHGPARPISHGRRSDRPGRAP